MTKKSNIKSRYEQRIDNLEEELDIYKKSLRKAANMLSFMVPPDVQVVENDNGTYFKDPHFQELWLITEGALDKGNEQRRIK